MTTLKQKIEIAQKHMKEKGISFGCSYGDEMGLNLFIAGMTEMENRYDHTIREFKDAYKKLFEFHCQEIIKK